MIRPATVSDYEGISAIRNDLVLDISKLDDPAYVALVEQRGFLLPVDMPQSDFETHVSNYIVGEVDGRVAGFLSLRHDHEMDADEAPRWVDPEMEQIYWGFPHAGIGKIAVSPGFGRRGIAADLLVEAERRTREEGIHHLFSFIVTCQPPTNHPSLRFHKKHGFQTVAVLDPQVAYGISDYRAELHGKQLS